MSKASEACLHMWATSVGVHVNMCGVVGSLLVPTAVLVVTRIPTPVILHAHFFF